MCRYAHPHELRVLRWVLDPRHSPSSLQERLHLRLKLRLPLLLGLLILLVKEGGRERGRDIRRRERGREGGKEDTCTCMWVQIPPEAALLFLLGKYMYTYIRMALEVHTGLPG